MKTYEFSVIASGLDHTSDSFEARFYDGGCDDALVSFQKGHTILDFARESASIDDAISSAIRDMMAAGAQIVRVEPDPLVSLTDIAFRSHLSKAAVTNYVKGERQVASPFPAPVKRVTTTSPLWDWSSVALWLWQIGRLSRDVVIEAQAFKLANGLLDCGEYDLQGSLKYKLQAFDHSLAAA